MKQINLIDSSKTNVTYRIDRFPDGEPQFLFTEEINRKSEYVVITRITNPEELFLLMEVGDILDRNGVIWNLEITYLMGMRMDRVMDFSRPFSLHIIGKMISSLGYKKCSIMTPHSDRTIHEIRDSQGVELSPREFINVVMNKPDGYCDMVWNEEPCDSVCVIYPDAGSVERYSCLDKEERIFYMHFDKTRDISTGKILSFDLHEDCGDPDEDMEFLFYDDLCDAGGTFLGELAVLKEKYPDHKFSIRVTHLVNEKGLDNLASNFDKVYITNSYRDWDKVATEKGYTNVIVR